MESSESWASVNRNTQDPVYRKSAPSNRRPSNRVIIFWPAETKVDSSPIRRKLTVASTKSRSMPLRPVAGEGVL